ncbi:Hypothetical predicted protein [Octopus vulgaris]|uniref:Uncharacterized protein n=1 Tax=Octopus vulgaris TaxID=6645 RepID=A0AA36FE70_OCTVU|nr:Hypothetical predicted protein [Octopus vulgaris]
MEVTFPPPHTLDLKNATSDHNEEDKCEDKGDDYTPDKIENLQLFTQEGLNDLVNDLNLAKDTAELLGSRLKMNKNCYCEPSLGIITGNACCYHSLLRMNVLL